MTENFSLHEMKLLSVEDTRNQKYIMRLVKLAIPYKLIVIISSLGGSFGFSWEKFSVPMGRFLSPHGKVPGFPMESQNFSHEDLKLFP